MKKMALLALLARRGAAVALFAVDQAVLRGLRRVFAFSRDMAMECGRKTA